jgi:hypothetical protein
MRTSKKCPKCECEYIAHFPKLTQSTDLQHPQYGTASSDILEQEAYVCSGCNYMETYLTMPFDKIKEEGIVFSWLRSPPESEGPYR